MQLNELRNKIKEYSQSYYEGNPTISDVEFDTMILQLEELSPGDELLQQISYGYSPEKDTAGEKIPHKYLKVGSLAKINQGTAEKYFSTRKGKQYIITSKIDGGSIVCYYDSTGKFDKAITRGSGKFGIDCTSKLKYLVPSNVLLPNIAIRGEIIMKQSIFDEFYPDAASPRNTSLGIINKDEPTEDEIKRLTFLTYNVYGDNENIPKTKVDILKWLKSNKFTTTEWDYLQERSETLEELKGKFDPDFPSDGLVLTDNKTLEEIAYKFVAETAETTVTGVTWEGSRLGNLIPVVHFNTVKLSGANLVKCSGFNARWVLDNAIGTGAKIIVHRSGEVIPYIKEILTRGETYIPVACPTCDSLVEWKGVHLFCPNENCPSKVEANLLHWCNTIARIDSLGESILIPFLKAMEWKSVLDIYTASGKDWVVQIRQYFPTHHAQNMLIELYQKLYDDPIDPDIFLAAFGFAAIGTTVSKMISKEHGLEIFFAFDNKPILENWKFSRTIAKPAVKSLEDNYNMMYQIYNIIKERQGFIEKVLNKDIIKIVITGKLSKGRKELTEEFALHGIEVIGSVSRDVKYLITDDPGSGSNKNLAAQKLGIMAISEEEFRKEMIK
ncbi:MAG: hypothetical protein ABIC57_00595 [bacterium]